MSMTARLTERARVRRVSPVAQGTSYRRGRFLILYDREGRFFFLGTWPQWQRGCKYHCPLPAQKRSCTSGGHILL